MKNALLFNKNHSSFSGLKSGKLFLFLFCILLLAQKVSALQGDIGAHDPSSIVKDGSNYYIFCTGTGPYCITSTDLVKWTNCTSTKSPYNSTNWPSWISTYVPTFGNYNGTFWAPECIYMNGKYYLYYACSTWASKLSCIGLATTPSLTNPVWTDQGMVVYSNNSSDYNAIDPDVFLDASGNAWLTYGSWNTGIKMQQLSTTTGKPLNSTKYSVCTFTDSENSQVVRNGSYYYLFVNRGTCCNGTSSTYYVQVGRATSPTGPYSGWRTVLDDNSSSTNIGPGALGYYSGDGAEWATYHYYDSRFNGVATLAVGKYTWSSGWPVISLNWLSNGTYKITNVNSGLVWDAWGCTGVAGQSIAQGTWNNLLCQKWDLTALGEGYYKITCGLGGLAADAINCSDAWGTKLDLYTYWGGLCQKFQINRTNAGNYVLSQPHAANGNYNPVVDVPNASTAVGTVLQLWAYTANNCQKWTFTGTTKSANENEGVSIASVNKITLYPNPVKKTLNLEGEITGCSYQIYSTDGKLVKKDATLLPSIDVSSLRPGLYIMSVKGREKSTTLRFVKE